MVWFDVRSGLDPKDLEKDASVGCETGRSAGLRGGQGSACTLNCARQHRNGAVSTGLWPFHRCQLDSARQQAIAAGAPVAFNAGNRRVHRAVCIHLAHRHVGAMSVRHTHRSSHGAQLTGKGRLNGKQRHCDQGSDLEQSLHLLVREYSPKLPKSVSQVT